MRLSLRARLALASGGLVLLVATAVAIAGYLALAHAVRGQTRRAALAAVTQITRQIDTGLSGDTPSQAHDRQGNFVDLGDPSLVGQLVPPGLWAAVVAPTGIIIGASRSAPQALATPPLLDACRRVGGAETTLARPSAIVICRRVGAAASPVGFVVTAAPLADTNRTLASTQRALALAVVVGSAGAFLLAWVTAARALRPLRRIARTARSIREGDLSRRIDHRRHDELGEVAAELDASFAELEGVLRRQERFVADASHELKTPLAAARANVQLLRRWAADNPVARAEALAALDRSTARIGRIVADLIQLAHGDDRLRYARQPVQLAELLVEAQREARAPSGDADVVICEIDPEAVVMGDRDRLQQLLANLIDNARRVTPPSSPVRLALTADQQWVRVRVADSGPGIPADKLTRVFDRFYRGTPPASGSGSGLGLAIARAIARAHDGDIEVESEEGQGSVFTLVLPRLLSSDRHPGLTDRSSAVPTVIRTTRGGHRP